MVYFFILCTNYNNLLSSFVFMDCSPSIFTPSSVWVSFFYALCFEWIGIFMTRVLYDSVSKVNTSDATTQYQHEFHMRCVSTLFACSVLPFTWYSLCFQHQWFMRFTVQYALGFFLWDLHLCIKYFKNYGIAFLLHAVFCTMTYFIASVYQSMITYSLMALCYESSTPLLNLRWLLRTVLKHDGKWWIYCNQAFAVVFLSVRMGYGSYLTWKIMHHCYFSRCEPLWIRFASAWMITLAFALNCWWSRIIVKRAIQHLTTVKNVS